MGRDLSSASPLSIQRKSDRVHLEFTDHQLRAPRAQDEAGTIRAVSPCAASS